MRRLHLLVIAASLEGLIGCASGTSSTTPIAASCRVIGTTVNLGSGATFGGGDDGVNFTNGNLVSVVLTGDVAYIKDVGPTSCLESMASWPGSSEQIAAYVSGHGYVARFPANNGAPMEYVRFIVVNSSQGGVLMTYDFPFVPQ